jgi:hypothetical protein
MLLGQHRPDQAQHRLAVGKDPDHVGAPPQLLVEPLLRIVRPDLPPVLLGKGREGQQLASRIAQQLGCLGKPLLELLDYAGVLGPGGGGVRLGEDRPHQRGDQPWADLGTLVSRFRMK